MKKSIFSLGLAVLFGMLVFCSCVPSPHVGVDSSGLDPFVIGGIGPLTEDRAGYGLSVRNGAQIAVDEINATGGVNGFRLVLNFQDSKGDPKTAVSVYEKLLANDMKVLLGGVFSDETAALTPVAGEDGLLMVTPTASHTAAVGDSGNVFRICFEDSRLGMMAANFLIENRIGERAAVVYADNTFGGKEQAESFLSVWEGRGGTADVYDASVEVVSDFSGVINQLLNTKVDVLYLGLAPEDSAAFLEAFEWDGLTSPITVIGASGLEGILETSDAPTTLEGMYVTTSFSADDSSVLVQNFVSVYTEAYGMAPDRYAADAYDGVYAIAEAMKKAGITPENVDNNDFNAKMISAMNRIEVKGVTGVMSWTTDGETTRPGAVKVIRDGKYVTYAKNGE